jgi:hypothetical protein
VRPAVRAEAAVISCTDFIPAYSELFKFLDAKGGRPAVEEFWAYLADTYLGPLRDLAARDGLRGCWEYWARALNEEAADFTMELDEEAGEFRIVMRRCPSKARLLENRHLEPYASYCDHCDALYRRVLEPLGFRYEIDLSENDRARCIVRIARPPKR